MPFGILGWCLDDRGEPECVRPGPPWTGWWAAGTGRTPSRTTCTTCDGSPGGAACHGAPRRTGVPSTGDAAATRDGTTPGASHCLTTAASDPAYRCAAARGPARGRPAA
ncbi:hypothetical protein QA640_30195 [Bradyrhizobium sp. CB82]|uniref:hypothetical protein n=1 Tax=Bradyrhizobium sp. CB82 TaxID=3039159 RepID=UPI0024B09A5D|nr:hypothetical protein [Bradyrhizobium sp. CB82]WFU38669.1 hypothetical protein QA640_30195 [Bradyrhizobium sp. CB82]